MAINDRKPRAVSRSQKVGKMRVDHPVFGNRHNMANDFRLAGGQTAGARAGPIVQLLGSLLNLFACSFADFRKAIERPADRGLGKAEVLGKLFEVDDIIWHGRASVFQTALIMAMFSANFQAPLWMGTLRNLNKSG